MTHSGSAPEPLTRFQRVKPAFSKARIAAALPSLGPATHVSMPPCTNTTSSTKRRATALPSPWFMRHGSPMKRSTPAVPAPQPNSPAYSGKRSMG